MDSNTEEYANEKMPPGYLEQHPADLRSRITRLWKRDLRKVERFGNTMAIFRSFRRNLSRIAICRFRLKYNKMVAATPILVKKSREVHRRKYG